MYDFSYDFFIFIGKEVQKSYRMHYSYEQNSIVYSKFYNAT